MKKVNLLQVSGRDFIDWGRHATVNGRRGEGAAVVYRGEAADVMRLVLLYVKGGV